MLRAMSTHDTDTARARRMAHTLQRARESAALTLRELGQRAGTSHSTLSAYEKAQKVPSVATFLRILEACGFAVDVHLAPRIRERDGLKRGKELEQALELAGQFPARHSRKPNYPRFARQ